MSIVIFTGVGVPGAICDVLALNSLQKSAERIPLAPVTYRHGYLVDKRTPSKSEYAADRE